MSGIFISYRQDDAKAWAIALRDDLAEVFGEDQLFLDKDSMHAGDWRKQIQHELERCTVVLVVIGPLWLKISDAQNRPRIQLPDDVHRQEIAFALSRADVTIIPVLVDDAALPRADQLPPDLQRLTSHQARKIGDTRARRTADLAVLVQDIHSVIRSQPRSRTAAKKTAESKPAPRRTRWLRPNLTVLGGAFALTLVAGTYAYLVNSPLTAPELLFLILTFWAILVMARWLWTRARGSRGTQT